MNSSSTVFVRINEMLDRLTPVEGKIAKQIMDNPHKILTTSIDELADTCNTTKTSVVRLCKTLGYTGYKQLHVALSIDMQSNKDMINSTSDINPGDDVHAIIKNTCNNHIKTLQDCFAIIDEKVIEKAVDIIADSKRIHIFGVGNSALVAQDAQNKFLRINKNCSCASDPHTQILQASTLSENDLAIIISYSGESIDILNLLNIIKDRGATILAITRYGGNSVSSQADLVIATTSNEPFMRSGAMTSRVGQLYIIDVLYTAVASKYYKSVKKHLDFTRVLFDQTKKHGN